MSVYGAGFKKTIIENPDKLKDIEKAEIYDPNDPDNVVSVDTFYYCKKSYPDKENPKYRAGYYYKVIGSDDDEYIVRYYNPQRKSNLKSKIEKDHFLNYFEPKLSLKPSEVKGSMVYDNETMDMYIDGFESIISSIKNIFVKKSVVVPGLFYKAKQNYQGDKIVSSFYYEVYSVIGDKITVRYYNTEKKSTIRIRMSKTDFTSHFEISLFKAPELINSKDVIDESLIPSDEDSKPVMRVKDSPIVGNYYKCIKTKDDKFIDGYYYEVEKLVWDDNIHDNKVTLIYPKEHDGKVNKVKITAGPSTFHEYFDINDFKNEDELENEPPPSKSTSGRKRTIKKKPDRSVEVVDDKYEIEIGKNIVGKTFLCIEDYKSRKGETPKIEFKKGEEYDVIDYNSKKEKILIQYYIDYNGTKKYSNAIIEPFFFKKHFIESESSLTPINVNDEYVYIGGNSSFDSVFNIGNTYKVVLVNNKFVGVEKDNGKYHRIYRKTFDKIFQKKDDMVWKDIEKNKTDE